MKQPSWFRKNEVLVSSAKTCGLAQGGRPKFLFDEETGKSLKCRDPETGGEVEKLDDELASDADCIISGLASPTVRYVSSDEINLRSAVPIYYDQEFDNEYQDFLKDPRFEGFDSASLGELEERGLLLVSGGHGSPSSTERVGEIPYIKVSDLRAGLVNINPTNRVPISVAERFWGGSTSGLEAFDLLCPARTSKNIGDFCILLPDQENVVVTKEVLRIRATDTSDFDQFYLIWALSLKVVRNQWKRIVFMQTNREDVGARYREIRIPIPPSPKVGKDFSEPFRTYYTKLAESRSELGIFLNQSKEHHFFVTG